MKYSKDDIIKALECCSLLDGESCGDYPLEEEYIDHQLASMIAESSIGLIKDLLHKNEELIERMNTFKEYALKMQALLENIKIKENEGYEFSAAKYAAEMDMWRVIASEKRALQDENKRLLARLRIKNLEESKNVIH